MIVSDVRKWANILGLSVFLSCLAALMWPVPQSSLWVSQTWLSSNPLHNPQLCELDRGTVWVSCAYVRQHKSLLLTVKIYFPALKNLVLLFQCKSVPVGCRHTLGFCWNLRSLPLKWEQKPQIDCKETVSAHMGHIVGNGHVVSRKSYCPSAEIVVNAILGAYSFCVMLLNTFRFRFFANLCNTFF